MLRDLRELRDVVARAPLAEESLSAALDELQLAQRAVDHVVHTAHAVLAICPRAGRLVLFGQVCPHCGWRRS